MKTVTELIEQWSESHPSVCSLSVLALDCNYMSSDFAGSARETCIFWAHPGTSWRLIGPEIGPGNTVSGALLPGL